MKTLSIKVNERGGARLKVSQAVGAERHLCYLEAFGPASEVRCCAQLLKGGSFKASIDSDPEVCHYNITIADGCDLRIVPLENDYMGLIVYPLDTTFLIGKTDEDLFDLFSRYVDQKHFGCKQWYQDIFEELDEIEPWVGNMKCRHNTINVEQLICDKLSNGTLTLPPSQHDIDIEIELDEEQAA